MADLTFGERVVGLWSFDTSEQTTEPRSLHEFETWRDELTTIEELGAATRIMSNLISADGQATPVDGVAITATAFRLTRVPPLFGGQLIDADERAGAASVAVIGYDLWQSRFGGDPGIVGRSVQWVRSHRTVVGVMPQGYTFPITQVVRRQSVTRPRDRLRGHVDGWFRGCVRTRATRVASFTNRSVTRGRSMRTAEHHERDQWR